MAALSTPARHPDRCSDTSAPRAPSLPAITFERQRGTTRATLPSGYRRREPEKSVFHELVREHLETFLEQAALPDGDGYPPFVEREFRRCLDCGLLCNGFARLRCPQCGYERLVAFSYKGKLCPSASHATATRSISRRAMGGGQLLDVGRGGRWKRLEAKTPSRTVFRKRVRNEESVRGSAPTSRGDGSRAVRATGRRDLTLVVEGKVRLRGSGGDPFRLSEAVRDADLPAEMSMFNVQTPWITLRAWATLICGRSEWEMGASIVL